MKNKYFTTQLLVSLIGLILSIIFSLIYAPSTYAPLSPDSLIGQVMAQHQVHGALVLPLLYSLSGQPSVFSSTLASDYSVVTGACSVQL